MKMVASNEQFISFLESLVQAAKRGDIQSFAVAYGTSDGCCVDYGIIDKLDWKKLPENLLTGLSMLQYRINRDLHKEAGM